MNCETNFAICPIFRTMDPTERDAILRLAKFDLYSRGETILRQDSSKPSGLWMLRSGSCEVVADLEHGAEQQIAFLSTGAVFGELSFFDPANHSATVRVIEDAEVMHLALADFERLELTHLSAIYKLLRNLGRIMAQKLRKMDHYTVDLFAYGGTTQRTRDCGQLN